MIKYSISQVSKKLHFSRDTLRYYDKIGLVSPIRGENNYRYYTEDEMNNLMYIRVMKYAGLSLQEIQAIFHNMESNDESRKQDTIQLLEAKNKETIKKIEHFREISKLLLISIEKLENKQCQKDMTDLVVTIFDNIEIF